MKLKNFTDLFAKLFWDIKLIGEQILILYPTMSRQAQSQELKDVLGSHMKEIQSELPRIENILKTINGHHLTPEENSTKSLFASAEKLIHENKPSPLLDAALIAVLLQIEHLEAATYTSLEEYADAVDAPEIKNFLEDSIRDIHKVNETLEALAKKRFFTPVALPGR